MTDPTEAKALTDARRDLLSSLTGNTARPSTWESAVMDVFEEVVRATEREKVRALALAVDSFLDGALTGITGAAVTRLRDAYTKYQLSKGLARDEVPE